LAFEIGYCRVFVVVAAAEWALSLSHLDFDWR